MCVFLAIRFSSSFFFFAIMLRLRDPILVIVRCRVDANLSRSLWNLERNIRDLNSKGNRRSEGIGQG